MKGEFGAEQRIKWRHTCGMVEVHCGFSRQMWNKPQGVIMRVHGWVLHAKLTVRMRQGEEATAVFTGVGL